MSFKLSLRVDLEGFNIIKLIIPANHYKQNFILLFELIISIINILYLN